MFSTYPPTQSLNHRLGLHYFPDSLHYREADLQTWLPELQGLGIGWLVLLSEQQRAIPEHFLRGLKQAGIEPIIRLQLSLEQLPDLKGLGTLLEVYGRWGARYLVLYDRPNRRDRWPAAGWAQQDLVERFLDLYLPAANLALQAGMAPVFPPLEPGGSYWDTAFLRSALVGIQRRKQEGLLQRMALSAYAWHRAGRSLDWGAGGPERWPQARPYQQPGSLLPGGSLPAGGTVLPEASQDQRDFRIFEWYQAIARSVLHQPIPVMLFQAGLPGDPERRPAAGTGESAEAGPSAEEQDKTTLQIALLLDGETVPDPLVAGNELDPVGDEVIACNFWLMSAASDSPHLPQAWFDPDGTARPVVEALRERQREAARQAHEAAQADAERSIRHYLLLPGYEWGVSDWYLEVIRPFVKKHRPTVGFSVEEAAQAGRVTVVGNAQNYPPDLMARLQTAGCFVEQIGGDGTNIATELSQR